MQTSDAALSRRHKRRCHHNGVNCLSLVDFDWQIEVADASLAIEISASFSINGGVFVELRSRITAWVAALTSLFVAGSAHAQELSDPAGSGVLVSAVRWLEGTLLGTVATVVAVIAVATVGFMMLTGRINWRYGATVILGCFILFGAASIVAGIQSTASLGR